MIDNTCNYCTENEALHALMIPMKELKCSKLYLFKNQSYPGRCLIAFNDHVNEFHDLTDEQAALFAADMKAVSAAIAKAFSPKKVNMGMYNDKGGHLHCHIVPKYENGMSFGAVFEMNPEPGVYLTDAQYQETIAKIMASL